MAAVKVADERLTVELQGIDRFWALRRRIRMPLTHVRSIEPTPHRTWRSAGFRVLGAEVPGLLRVGRFSYHGERIFWEVHHPERTIEVELVGEPFDRLIVEVVDPRETTREVQRAMARRSAARCDRSVLREGGGLKAPALVHEILANAEVPLRLASSGFRRDARLGGQ